MSLKVKLYSTSAGVAESDIIRGLDKLTSELKRSKKYDTVMHEFTVNLGFQKSAHALLEKAYEAEGPQGQVRAVIYQYNPNTYTWETYFEGKIKLMNYKHGAEEITTNIEQVGFQRTFINGVDLDFDIETLVSRGLSALPATPSYNLELHSKTILKKTAAGITQADYSFGLSELGEDFTHYISIPFEPTVDEIDNFIGYGIGYGLSDPTTVNKYNYLFSEAGLYKIRLNRLLSSFHIVNTGGSDCVIDVFFKYGQPGALTEVNLFNDTRANGEFDVDIDINYSADINFNVGDVAYLYIRYQFLEDGAFDSGAYSYYSYLPTDTDALSDFQVEAETIFAATSSKAYFVHEALRKAAEYITGVTGSFYSEFLGLTEMGYDEDGAGALLTITSGGDIRGLGKQTFISWSKVFDSVAALYNLGWSFELRPDGNGYRVRVEKKEFFYQNVRVLELTDPVILSTEAEKDYYYNQFEFSYPKIENINQINALDEINTVRRYNIPFTESDKPLKVSSRIRASGYEIEAQRRLRTSTKESKLDEELFFVCVVRDGEGFETERDQNLAESTGIFDPPTAYNIRISPGRVKENWGAILAVVLHRSTNKVLTFNYGEINYQASSRLTSETAIVYENGSFDLTNVRPQFIADKYTFTTTLAREEFTTLRANTSGYVRFPNDVGVKKDGFILNVKHYANEKKADFDLLRLYRL